MINTEIISESPKSDYFYTELIMGQNSTDTYMSRSMYLMEEVQGFDILNTTYDIEKFIIENQNDIDFSTSNTDKRVKLNSIRIDRSSSKSNFYSKILHGEDIDQFFPIGSKIYIEGLIENGDDELKQYTKNGKAKLFTVIQTVPNGIVINTDINNEITLEELWGNNSESNYYTFNTFQAPNRRIPQTLEELRRDEECKFPDPNLLQIMNLDPDRPQIWYDFSNAHIKSVNCLLIKSPSDHPEKNQIISIFGEPNIGDIFNFTINGKKYKFKVDKEYPAGEEISNAVNNVLDAINEETTLKPYSLKQNLGAIDTPDFTNQEMGDYFTVSWYVYREEYGTFDVKFDYAKQAPSFEILIDQCCKEVGFTLSKNDCCSFNAFDKRTKPTVKLVSKDRELTVKPISCTFNPKERQIKIKESVCIFDLNSICGYEVKERNSKLNKSICKYTLSRDLCIFDYKLRVKRRSISCQFELDKYNVSYKVKTYQGNVCTDDFSLEKLPFIKSLGEKSTSKDSCVSNISLEKYKPIGSEIKTITSSENTRNFELLVIGNVANEIKAIPPNNPDDRSFTVSVINADCANELILDYNKKSECNIKFIKLDNIVTAYKQSDRISTDCSINVEILKLNSTQKEFIRNDKECSNVTIERIENIAVAQIPTLQTTCSKDFKLDRIKFPTLTEQERNIKSPTTCEISLDLINNAFANERLISMGDKSSCIIRLENLTMPLLSQRELNGYERSTCIYDINKMDISNISERQLTRSVDSQCNFNLNRLGRLELTLNESGKLKEESCNVTLERVLNCNLNERLLEPINVKEESCNVTLERVLNCNLNERLLEPINVKSCNFDLSIPGMIISNEREIRKIKQNLCNVTITQISTINYDDRLLFEEINPSTNCVFNLRLNKKIGYDERTITNRIEVGNCIFSFDTIKGVDYDTRTIIISKQLSNCKFNLNKIKPIEYSERVIYDSIEESNCRFGLSILNTIDYKEREIKKIINKSNCKIGYKYIQKPKYNQREITDRLPKSECVFGFSKVESPKYNERTINTKLKSSSCLIFTRRTETIKASERTIESEYKASSCVVFSRRVDMPEGLITNVKYPDLSADCTIFFRRLTAS